MGSPTEVVEHVCHIGEDGYCDCRDISPIGLEKSRKTLPEIGILTLEEVGRELKPGRLVCRACGHRGILTDDISGASPRMPGYSCNNELDFAICPRCCHWAIVDPFNTQIGTRV